MSDINNAVKSFLNEECIAVAGASSDHDGPANLIFRRFKSEGKRVYPVNPKGGKLGPDDCYRDIASLPETPDGVVIVTTPEATEELVEQCISRGVKRVWMHRAVGTSPPGFLQKNEMLGSVSERAVQRCRENGISVIPGACPMQFGGDFGHACMRVMLKLVGGLR